MKIKFLSMIMIFGGMAVAEMQKVEWNDSAISWDGRIVLNEESVQMDWPAVRMRTEVEGDGKLEIKIIGKAVFSIFVNGKETKVFRTDEQSKWYEILDLKHSGTYDLELIKASENQSNTVKLVGLRKSRSINLAKPEDSKLRIQFMGDSYTAGFGNISSVREPLSADIDSTIFYTTRTDLSYGVLLSRKLRASYQILAYSGVGIVQNYEGMNPGKEYMYYYPYSLVSARNNGESSPEWNFQSWIPNIVVIALGINDFQGMGLKAKEEIFIDSYRQLLSNLRKDFPNVKMVLAATGIWPEDILIPAIKKILNLEIADGNRDIKLFLYQTERTGLYWHPDLNDHRNLAEELEELLEDWI
jgi:hypothetical protein